MKFSINGRFLLQDVTGVQRVAIDFIRALDELIAKGQLQDLEVTLWVPRTGQLVTELSLKSIMICRAGRLSGHAWEQIQLPLLARRSVLLCLGNTAPVARLVFRRNATYTMVHDLAHRYYPIAYSRSFRLFYNTVMPIVLARVTHIFTVSDSEKASILREYPRITSPQRVTAAPNGGGEAAIGARISSTPASLRSGSPSVPSADLRSPMCLYVGSLTRRKNSHGLMDAAVQLADKLNTTFVFVGSTPAIFEELAAVSAQNHRQIRWVGQVNDPERIEEFYRQAKVFVFPSFSESSGLPPVEAMSFGTPVVCSDIPSLRERCGDAAVYCDPSDVASIVEKVTALLTDESLWQELQQKGLVRAAQFTWENQVKTVLKVMSTS